MTSAMLIQPRPPRTLTKAAQRTQLRSANLMRRVTAAHLERIFIGGSGKAGTMNVKALRGRSSFTKSSLDDGQKPDG